eukprot:COSAG02_NODE_7772_length_2853_cov_1.894336_4_plen_103_part_00
MSVAPEAAVAPRSVHVTMGVQLPRWGDLIEGACSFVSILMGKSDYIRLWVFVLEQDWCMSLAPVRIPAGYESHYRATEAALKQATPAAKLMTAAVCPVQAVR